jgi:hypothetical protein
MWHGGDSVWGTVGMSGSSPRAIGYNRAVDWIAFLFISPLAIMGILLAVFAATVKEMVEASPRYAKSPKYSVGFYRAFGIGIVVAAAIIGWLMAQPISSHVPKPFPSTQVGPK